MEKVEKMLEDREKLAEEFFKEKEEEADDEDDQPKAEEELPPKVDEEAENKTDETVENEEKPEGNEDSEMHQDDSREETTPFPEPMDHVDSGKKFNLFRFFNSVVLYHFFSLKNKTRLTEIRKVFQVFSEL
jgi:hypothetical protein